MNIARYMIAGLLCVSCAGGGLDERGLGADGTGRFGETAMEQYEEERRLEENPLDPKRATRDMLLSIPGFPTRLADRIIETRERNPAGTRWITLLTPPEREALYRFARFLVLPTRRPARIRARVGRSRICIDGAARTDAYLSVESDRWRLRARGRSARGAAAVSPYMSRMTASSSVHLCIGDFMPDVAMGLLFNGSPYYYPFSSGFPLRGRRWVVPAPSWYREGVRGCAVEAWRGRVRCMVFGGHARSYDGSVVAVDDRWIWGGRVRAGAGGGSAGITIRRNEGDGGGPICAMDGGWRRGDLRTAAEVVAAGRGAGALTWGASLRSEPVDVGVVTYRVPFAFGSGFAAVPGGAIRASSWQRGYGTVVSGTVRENAVARVSYERYVSGDASRSKRKETIRAQLELRWKPLALRLSYRRRFERRGRGIPYPAGVPAAAERSDSGCILCNLRRGAALRIRVSARYVGEKRGKGYVVSTMTRFGLLGNRLGCTLAGSLCRAVGGDPILYTYEPVLEGSYPWISMRGNSWRGSLLIEMRRGGLILSGRAVTGTRRDGEVSLMLSFRR